MSCFAYARVMVQCLRGSLPNRDVDGMYLVESRGSLLLLLLLLRMQQGEQDKADSNR